MKTQQVLQEFTDAGAILRGHFILSSGLHSDTYMQCARVLMDARRAERLCKALAEKLAATIDISSIDMVFSPAMGGVVVGYEMGRQLQKPAIFCERVDGKFALRRGFGLEKGARVLVVEDVVTTGKSSLEAMECARLLGAEIIAEACLIDRSNGEAAGQLGVPLVSLAQIEVKTFPANNVPAELAHIPAIKPGSRHL